jgi:hypothetical protein
MFWLWGGLLFWFGLFFGCYLLGISAFFPMRRMLGYVGLLGVSMGKYVEILNLSHVGKMELWTLRNRSRFQFSLLSVCLPFVFLFSETKLK